jgi:hypothetical protein
MRHDEAQVNYVCQIMYVYPVHLRSMYEYSTNGVRMWCSHRDKPPSSTLNRDFLSVLTQQTGTPFFDPLHYQVLPAADSYS